MLKPLLISSMLLGSLCLQAQESTTSRPPLIHGFENSAILIPYDCEELNIRHLILLQPKARHIIAIGVDRQLAIYRHLTLTDPALVLGYKYLLNNFKEKWRLSVLFDTEQRMSKGEWRNRYIYSRSTEFEMVKSKYTKYVLDLHPGLGATWDFHSQLALNLAVGPTVTIRHYRNKFADNPENNYNWTGLDLHFYISAGLVYKLFETRGNMSSSDS